MCDGMVAFQTRALSSSSSSSLAHRLAASTLLLLFILLPHGHASGKLQTHTHFFLSVYAPTCYTSNKHHLCLSLVD